MIDNKDIQAYLSIKAPDTLKERLDSENARKDRYLSTISRSLYAVAAALLVIVAVFAFLPSFDTELLYNGGTINSAVEINELDAIAPRTVSAEVGTTEIPLEIKTRGKTVVSVTAGEIRLSDSKGKASLTVDSDVSLVWTVGDISVEEHILTVRRGKSSLSYSISINNETGKTVLSKVK